MQSAKELLPLVAYQPPWLIIGCCLIGIVVLWLAFVFWWTRHRTQKTISTIGPKAIVGRDLDNLKAKYIGLIDEVQQLFSKQQITARVLHQKLSLLVRLFAFEATGFRAPVMTLADIQKGRFPALRDVISTYYPNEFNEVLQGSADDAVMKAKGLVTSWQ